MKLSNFFMPVLKEKPVEAQTISHTLMLRAGMMRQVSAGIYAWLPLGLKVLNKVANIVRKNMDAAGCIEMLMPCIQPASLWRESGRYDAYGKEMLRITDRHENEMLFGPTNEEMITDIFKSNVKSYKELPKILYHIQWKFRDEIRPRFGVMRGREFLMKDAYSFDISREAALATYDKIFVAYSNTFKDLGIVAIPMKAETGPIGGDHSHEFHVIADTGESTLYYDRKFDDLMKAGDVKLETILSLYAATEDKHVPGECSVPEKDLIVRKGIEVGHIFYFGTKYSESMGATVQNADGELVKLEMGSYGIGVSRLVAAIIEASHDENGIIWPVQVAPFRVSLVNIHADNSDSTTYADELYETLISKDVEVLYDDTQGSVGSKLATHDLIGTPWQVIVSKKLVGTGNVELRNRKNRSIEVVDVATCLNMVRDLTS